MTPDEKAANANPNRPTAEQFLAAAKVADPAVFAAFLLERIGMPTLPTSHYPDWARNCANKVNTALFPKVFEAIENDALSPAYSTGVAFGMMTGAQSRAGELTAALPADLPAPTDDQIQAVWRWLYRGDAETATQAPDGDLIALEYREEFRRIENSLGPAELAQLHQGVADATRMIAGENKATETTKIYSVMLTYWRVVDYVQSIDRLIKFLRDVLGPNVVGSDPKRISQLCSRVGKSFRRPGRPRKTTST